MTWTLMLGDPDLNSAIPPASEMASVQLEARSWAPPCSRKGFVLEVPLLSFAMATCSAYLGRYLPTYLCTHLSYFVGEGKEGGCYVRIDEIHCTSAAQGRAKEISNQAVGVGGKCLSYPTYSVHST
jgi:hypothetical protein